MRWLAFSILAALIFGGIVGGWTWTLWRLSEVTAEKERLRRDLRRAAKLYGARATEQAIREAIESKL